MYGQNPKRPPQKGDGQTLQVKSIFPTLQGEGIYTGWPAVFVRLGGCNLACDFCDTDFEDFTGLSLEVILREVEALARNGDGAWVRKLVVLTGGEPMRQNIVPLCDALLEKGYKVQIETNGTIYRPLPDAVDVICSPKLASKANYTPLRPDILPQVDALKFIISTTHQGYDVIGDVGQAAEMPIYVQPMDEEDEAKNLANRELARHLADEHGYRLSLQTHKLLNIE